MVQRQRSKTVHRRVFTTASGCYRARGVRRLANLSVLLSRVRPNGRCPVPFTFAVRRHGRFPFPVPAAVDRLGVALGCRRIPSMENQGPGMGRSGKTVCRHSGTDLYRRRGNGHRAGVPVRHELGRVFQVRWGRFRVHAGLRGRHRVLHGKHIPGTVSLRTGPGPQRNHMAVGTPSGRRRYAFCVLDPGRCELATDSGGVCHQ